jgi:hypothetical protein
VSERSFAGFWEWWAGVNARIAAAIQDQTTGKFVDDITSQVKALDPGLAWELGPGRGSRHNLTLTAEGKIELRRLTERWAQSAPQGDPTWEYYPARQPAPNLKLSIGGRALDPNDWLFQSDIDEGRLVINLSGYHPVLQQLSERERSVAGFVALDQIFGEDAVEKWLGGLEFTTTKPRQASTPGDVLKMMSALAEESKKEVFSIAQGFDRDRHPLFLNFNRRLKRLDHLFAETRVQLDLQLQHPTTAGLTGDAEAEGLNLLEDQLLAASAAVVYVGRLTGNGRRSLYFYAEDPARAVDAMTRVAGGGAWHFGLHAEPDPQWSFYHEGIFKAFARAA